MSRTRTLAAVTVAAVASLAAPSAADAACKTYEHRAKIESDPFGTDLAYLNIKIRACTNGHRVTSAGTLDASPSYTNNAMGSMEFQGFSPEPIKEFRRWRGRSHGQLFVKAGGNFQQRAGGVTGRSSYIWASMKILGNGRVIKARKND